MSDLFARRTNGWQLDTNALGHALEESSNQQGVDDLTQSNPTMAGFSYPTTWLKALSAPQSLVYDPQSFGHDQARDALVKYYASRGLVVNREHVILTSSSSESYGFVLRLLVNPHEKVLIPIPSYPLFPYLLDIHDAAYVSYSLDMSKQWVIDRESLLAQLDPTVKVIMVVSPNNPTGSYINEDDRQWLDDVASKHGIAIVADEVFMDYALRVKPTSFLKNTKSLTFILGGLSKTVCLPQMKLGWLIPVGPLALVAQALKRLEIIADTYLSVNTPVQVAAAQWLNEVDVIQEQVIKRLKTNLDYAKSHCVGALRLIEPQAGWYLIVELPDHMDDEMFCLEALKKGVSVYPGYYFDLAHNHFIVVSLLTQADVFSRGWDKLCRMI